MAGHAAADSLKTVTNTGETFKISRAASEADTAPFPGTAAAQNRVGADNGGLLSDAELSELRASKGVGLLDDENADINRAILGFDVRTRNHTVYYPASAVVVMTFNGFYCTGFLIGDNTVATAGTCVHQGGGGDFYDPGSYVVYPGYDENSAPYGSCGARTLYSVLGWTRDGDERFNIGAVKLDCTIGNSTGWFGFRANAGNNEPTIVTGYPDDRSFQQWQSSDKVRRAETWQLLYANDTRPGNDGSPVWQDWWRSSDNTSQGPYAIGIHTYGTHGSGAHGILNHGTRLTNDFVDLLVTWKND